VFLQYQVNITGEEGESTGEYPIQEGFGWTNGIILEFLQKYNYINVTSTCIDDLKLGDRCRLNISSGDICTPFLKNKKKLN